MQFRRERVELLTVRPRGGDLNSRLSSDVRRYQILSCSLANEGAPERAETGRISGEHISPAQRRVSGPNSAPNLGRILPIKARRVSGVQIPLSPPTSLQSPAFSGETYEIGARARVPAVVGTLERPLGCLQRRIRPWFLHGRSWRAPFLEWLQRERAGGPAARAAKQRLEKRSKPSGSLRKAEQPTLFDPAGHGPA